MRTFLIRPALLPVLVLCLIALTSAQSAGQADKAESRKSAEKKIATGPTLPAGSILAVYDNLADALRQMPRAVVLTADKYQSLVEEIERLRKQLDRPRVRTPSGCMVKGKIEGGIAQLSITFDFETEKPAEQVRLGCGLAQATGVSLDGRTPQLRWGQRVAGPAAEGDADSFIVEIDRPGEHQLTLDVVLAVTIRPAVQSLKLDLPRAAITRMEMELPPGIRDVRLGGKPLAETLVSMKKNQVSGSLGPAGLLDLTWKPANASAQGAITESEGLVLLDLTRNDLATEARLTLRVLGGQVQQWRLMVPLGAKLEFTAADEARVSKIDTADQKNLSLRTIHLREVTSDPLAVTIRHTQAAPKPGTGKPALIGPYSVLGAVRHTGSLLVNNLVPDWHIEYTPCGDLTRRGVTQEELERTQSLVAAFRYGPGRVGEPALERKGRPASLAPHWLELEVEAVRGQVKTRQAHTISLTSEGVEPGWQIQTSMTVTPRWADIDRFSVQMPAGCEFAEEASSARSERVRQFQYNPQTRIVEVRLERPAETPGRLTPFTVRIVGNYADRVNLKVPGKATVGLPRPVGTVEQEATLTLQTGTPLLELTIPPASIPSLPGGPELTRQVPQEIAWRYPRRAPDHVEFAWRPYRSPLRVRSLADVTLAIGDVRIRQELRYTYPLSETGEPMGPNRLQVRLPAAVADAWQLIQGGQVVGTTSTSDGLVVTISPADVRTPLLVFELSCPLPRNPAGEVSNLPLGVPEQATGGESKVRIWSDSGELPAATRGWTEQSVEIVPGRDRLPVLVMQAARPDQPLALRLTPVESGSSALVERALVRVDVVSSGEQIYRVSYRLRQLAGRQIDLDLPAPAATLGVQVTLDDRRIDPEILATERADGKGRRIRLRLAPDLVRQPAVLRVNYTLDAGRARTNVFTTTLQGPRLVSETAAAPTRWQIFTPSGWVVLAPESSTGLGRRWNWRGLLFTSRLEITSADLERWFSGSDITSSGEVPPTLVLWQDAGVPVLVVHVPQQAWLLLCSLGVVFTGVCLSRLALARDSRGNIPLGYCALLILLVLAFLVLGLGWPGLMAHILYGGQPGLVVILVMFLLQGVLHERYRRQIVFLSSFSRPTRTGSSLVNQQPPRDRPSASERPLRPHGEPSTVDVPPSVSRTVPRPAGSSIDRTQ